MIVSLIFLPNLARLLRHLLPWLLNLDWSSWISIGVSVLGSFQRNPKPGWVPRSHKTRTRGPIVTSYKMEDKIYPQIWRSKNEQQWFVSRIRVPWEQNSKGTRTLTPLLLNIFYADCEHIWVVSSVAPEKYTAFGIFSGSLMLEKLEERQLRHDGFPIRNIVLLIFPLFKENQLLILISYLSQFFVNNHIISALYIWHLQ